MTPDPESPSAADPLEPGVRRFVDEVTEAARRGGGYGGRSAIAARALAERVRAPWRAGGPKMAVAERIAPGPRPVKIRVYAPVSDTSPRGALVYLHGGGWTIFSLDTHDRVMREYAARSGLNVIGVDYSLAPEARFPVALEEVKQVMRWLQREPGQTGVDPSRVALGGDSAGANLALCGALALRDEGAALPCGLLLNYGCYDIAVSDEMARRYGGEGFMLQAEEMAGFWRGYLRGPADANNPLVCPTRADLAGLPPVFMAIAECDILAEQNLEMAEQLRRAGVDVRPMVYRGASHSFLEAVSVSPLAARALQDGADWLRQTCAPASRVR
jgi:acetyl esterase